MTLTTNKFNKMNTLIDYNSMMKMID